MSDEEIDIAFAHYRRTFAGISTFAKAEAGVGALELIRAAFSDGYWTGKQSHSTKPPELEADLRECRAVAERYRRGLLAVRGLLHANMEQPETVRAWHAITDALGEDPIDELIKERDSYV